ncbi:cytochrome c biogenesis protein CcdA [Methanomicrobium sp. W14]|uniref:cytochrome c biogenesis protein n=1 Tax=Methanomicrobium sp. W14 TaxID=2817839 RepID=UPI001AE8D67C|nr:cytochrome c biogenesis protein [Methanomicrobium sp. W14]MBP2134051.1 cytochrome c biogenesis protein CcdA [Methanomicrobium sp. W14]
MILVLPVCAENNSGTTLSADPITSTGSNVTPEDLFKDLISDANTSVTIFYSSRCSSCVRVLPGLENLSDRYPEIKVRYYDLYNSTENLTLLYELGAQYHMHYVSYPILFTGDTVVLSGMAPITENSESVFEALDKGLIPDIEYEKRWIEEDEYKDSADLRSDIPAGIILVASAGLLDGINPCAFAVLIFLLISLMATDSGKKVLISGLFYTFAVFLFYTLAGLGIMSIVNLSGLSFYFSILAGIIAITAGLVNIIDSLRNDPRSSLSIPASSKGIIGKFVKRATLPSSFILGIIVGMFELPCTGGIYLAIISLLSSEMTFSEGVPYLILYNIFFVMPLLLITFAVFLGLSPKFVDSARLRYRGKVRLIMGIVLIAIGIFVVWWQI